MSLARLLTPLIASALACKMDLPYCDPAPAPYALEVTVRDSFTGQPIANGTIGTADALGIHDTLIGSPGDSLYLFSSRDAPGTYHIALRRDGYAPWNVSNVTVTRGRCGVSPVGVHGRLQPLAP